MARKGNHVVWKGDQVLERTMRAAMAGVDITLARAVNTAKSDHGWNNVTGTAEGSIAMRPAARIGKRVVGEFGSYDVEYFIWLELGTSTRAGDFTLNRAADQEFPHLETYIRSQL